MVVRYPYLMLKGSNSLPSSTLLSLALLVVLFPNPSHTCHPFRRCKAAARKETESESETEMRQSKLVYGVSTLDEFLGDVLLRWAITSLRIQPTGLGWAASATVTVMSPGLLLLLLCCCSATTLSCM